MSNRTENFLHAWELRNGLLFKSKIKRPKHSRIPSLHRHACLLAGFAMYILVRNEIACLLEIGTCDAFKQVDSFLASSSFQ